MTKDEALKMAIDALKNINGWRGLRDYEARALDACKEALERPEPKEPQYLYAYVDTRYGKVGFSTVWEEDSAMPLIGKIKLEVDDD